MSAGCIRMVMDMTNCAKEEMPGIYPVDIDNTWFTVPPGDFRDAILGHPKHMICVYHRKTEAHLYSPLDPVDIKGKIIQTPGYRQWCKTHGKPKDKLNLMLAAEKRGDPTHNVHN